jgi:hypothetical protein
MGDLIFISDTINAGKTTVSALLQEALPQAAHIEVDRLRHFVSWMPLSESILITFENAARVAENFLKNEFNVIFDYPLSYEQFRSLNARLAPLAGRVRAFILSPPLDVAASNRGNRVLTARELSRIRAQLEAGVHDPGFGVTLDNGAESPQITVVRVLEHLGVEPAA